MNQSTDETELGRGAVLDADFKEIMHNSDILSWMLRCNIDEVMGMDIEDIKACLTLGDGGRTVCGRPTEYISPENGSIITDTVFDVRVPNSDGKVSVIVNVEGQGDRNPGYSLKKRMAYYMGRMVAAQKGVEFSGNDYDKLRKCYSIWCIMDPRVEDENTVTRHRMTPENVFGPPDRKMETLDTFNIIVVNVGKYSESLPDVSAFPAVLFSPMKNKTRLTELGDRFNIHPDNKLMKKLREMTTLDQQRYNSGYRDGKNVGFTEGKDVGFTEGKAYQAVQTSADLILQIIRNTGKTVEEVFAEYSFSTEYRPEIESEVRKRLSQS